jgi:hypothetical protein
MNDFKENVNKPPHKKLLKKKINKVNNTILNSYETQIHKDKLNVAFKESIIKNKWFYLTLLLCFYMFKQSNPNNTSYILLIVSYIFILIVGHITHRISHCINFTNTYNKFKKNNMNPLIDRLLLKFFWFLDFHSETHHDSTINKQPANILYEFFNNVITQGGTIIILVKLINYLIDFRVVILWSLVYATTHNINYVFLKPSVHRDHHLNDNTNYGFDIADIIFDTKYNLDDIETHNHISINLLIITLLIVYFYKD